MHDISGTVMHTISHSDVNEFEGQIENEHRREFFGMISVHMVNQI